VVQAFCQCLLAVVLIFIPKTYFENNLFNTAKDLKEAEAEAEADAGDLVPGDDVSIFEYRYSDNGGAGGNKCNEFLGNLKRLMKHKVFIISTSSVIVLLFIVTAIQFWITDYLTVVIQADRDVITMAFCFTCVTAPTFGIITGGCIVQRYGGYEHKTASLICVIFGCIAGCCSILIPLSNNIYSFAVVLWLFFFFGGAIVPNIIGIYISSLPIELRGAGNSVSNILINCFGYLPAPYVYGAVFDATSHINKKISLTLIVNYCWVGVSLLGLSMFFRYRSFKKRESKMIEMIDKKGHIIDKDTTNDKDTNVGDGEIKFEFSEVNYRLLKN
jgi:MFS family permease